MLFSLSRVPKKIAIVFAPIGHKKKRRNPCPLLPSFFVCSHSVGPSHRSPSFPFHPTPSELLPSGQGFLGAQGADRFAEDGEIAVLFAEGAKSLHGRPPLLLSLPLLSWSLSGRTAMYTITIALVIAVAIHLTSEIANQPFNLQFPSYPPQDLMITLIQTTGERVLEDADRPPRAEPI